MSDKFYLNVIKILAIAIPLIVGILIYLPQKIDMGDWVYVLPHTNATVNSLTSILLVLAFFAIRNKNISTHKLLMSICFVLGSVFLISYVAYHSSVDSVIYGDQNSDGILSELENESVGVSRTIYIGVLLSHILLSMVVVPLVLLSFYYSLTGKIEFHKKIVKWTFPIWLYVSVTGVVVYFMIRPFYIH